MSQPVAFTADSLSWQQSYRFANFLLQAGVTVFWATGPFKVVTRSQSEQTLERGTFLITATPTDRSDDWLHDTGQRFGAKLLEMEHVEGFAGLQLRPLRIAMYGGGGAPYNHARIFTDLGFFVDFISPQEIRQGQLSEFDILAMPGGGGIAMKGQLDPLGDEGCKLITEFVQRGGMYMGSCAGAFDAAIVSDSFLTVCPQQRHMQLVNSAVWNRNDNEFVGLNSPGVGVLESRNLHPEHPVMFGMPEYFRITHYNGPFFESQPNTLVEASESIGLSAVAGFTEEFTPAEYFLRFDDYDETVAEETSLIGQAAREERFNIVSGYNGLGRVVLFGSHPEFGFNLAMDRWEQPARMLANAAFWQAGHLKEARSMRRKPVQGTPYSFPLGSGLTSVASRLDTIMDAVGDLKKQNTGDVPWLADEHAMSTFGLSAPKIWKRNLDEFDDVTSALKQTLSQAEAAVKEATSLESTLRNTEEESVLSLADSLHDALLGLEEAIHYRTPPEWNQDFGYEGVLQMLDRTEIMLKKARANFNQTFESSRNPYQHFDSSPYQLVVGSYLAAVGVYANSWFLVQVHLFRLEQLIYKCQIVLEKA